MAAYTLEATHSITRNRARETRRQSAYIEIHCTLTVWNLLLQTLIASILAAPLRSRCLRTISIHDIRSYRPVGHAGMRQWTFTVRLLTTDKKAKLRSWGRRRSHEDLAVLPIALLRKVERTVNDALYKVTRNPEVLTQCRATLRMLH
jgi:hypothetical protein